jgi:hypothetical protein
MALNEAAQAALTSGAATPAQVCQVTGLSRRELGHFLRDAHHEPFVLKSA